MVKASRDQFDIVLEAFDSGRAKDFVELEVIGFQENLHGALAKIKIIPTSALIDETIENTTIILHRINGPLFINRHGVQLGVARWELSVKKNDPDATEDALMGLDSLFSNQKPLASIGVSFFGNIHLRVDDEGSTLGKWASDALSVQGDIDFSSAQHQFQMDVSGINYRGSRLALDFSDLRLVSESSGQANLQGPNNRHPMKFNIDLHNGELVFTGQSKKIPFNLQSHGSIWVNNDTLSSDWQIKVSNEDHSDAANKLEEEKPGYLQTNISLQLREFLLSGFWQYLNNQSEVFSLLRQAEWAMEDMETPEQQDFLRSLFLDADRIQQSQLDKPLKPLLIAERSQLAANVLVTNNEGVSSQLSLGGTAVKRVGEPELELKGEARIKNEMLDSEWLALLDRWSRKQWFRRYETEFESDIAVRNERLLLNNIIMSVERLSAELSQTLTDQQ